MEGPRLFWGIKSSRQDFVICSVCLCVSGILRV